LQNLKLENIKAEHLSLLLGMNPRGVTSGMNFTKGQKPIDGIQRRGWKIPSLNSARFIWDQCRFKVTWPEGDPAENHLAEKRGTELEDWDIVPVGDERRSIREVHVIASGDGHA
jgi:hypothetical protein